MIKNTKDNFWGTDLGDLPNSVTPKLSRIPHLQKLIFGEISATIQYDHQQGEIYIPGIVALRSLAYKQVKGIIHHDPRVPYSYTDVPE